MAKSLFSHSSGFFLIVLAFSLPQLLPNPSLANGSLQQQAEFAEGQIIIKLKGKAKSIRSQSFVGKAVTEKSMSLKGSWAGLNMHHFILPQGKTVAQALDELKDDPDVEYAEPNYKVSHMSIGGHEAHVDSMESIYSAQAQASTIQQTGAPIQLSQAWAQMTPGLAPPIVAIIDTGIDFNHPVFTQSGAIWTNPNEIPANGIDDDHNGYIDDVHGWNFVAHNNLPQDDNEHGTHVSGIVLGATQNIFANPIAAAQIRIMPLKFLDSTGSGLTSDAVNAIYYAVNNGAKVLSNSWGGGGMSSSLSDAIQYSYNQGRIFVAAAGNASSNNDVTPTYPANYPIPNVMSIAATDDSDSWASFSNFGPQTVNISSPGVSIYSTLPNASLGYLSGTSMATPFVAGLAAIMVREQPSMNGYQLKSLLFSGAQTIPSLQGKTTQQARMNAYNGIMVAKGATVNSALPGARAPASAAASGGAGGCGLVKAIRGTDPDDDGGPGLSTPEKNLAFFGVLLAMAAPVLLSIALRSRSGRGQRRHTRYQIASSVRVKFGDRELVGQVSTISLGGLQLNTDAWLEKGGVVKMSIQSPDGGDEIQVEGKIVWSEEQKRYGVAFANAEESALTAISRWTQSLLKA